jgi:ribosomal protein L7/L12
VLHADQLNDGPDLVRFKLIKGAELVDTVKALRLLGLGLVDAKKMYDTAPATVEAERHKANKALQALAAVDAKATFSEIA